MAAEVRHFLEDVTLHGTTKLDEMDLEKQNGFNWLAGKEPAYILAMEKYAAAIKDGVFKVPKSTKHKQGGRGGNDENIPPGQHAIAVQTPAAAKKATKEESTPAPLMARTRALRDLPRRQVNQLATPAPVAAKTTTRLTTKNSAWQPAETISTISQTPQRPESTEPEAGGASSASNKDAEKEAGDDGNAQLLVAGRNSEAQGGIRRPPRGSPDTPREAENGAHALGIAEEARSVKVDMAAVERDAGAAPDTKLEEQSVEGQAATEVEIERSQKTATTGGPKRKGKKQAKEKDSEAPVADVSGAHADMDKTLPAGKASLGNEYDSLSQVPVAQTETEMRPESGAKKAGKRKAESASAEEEGDKDAANETAPVVRVTRRRAKETNAELAALPSGLADGREPRGRAKKAKKTRRKELDADEIRQEMQKEKLETAETDCQNQEPSVEPKTRLETKAGPRGEGLEERESGVAEQLDGVEMERSTAVELCMGEALEQNSLGGKSLHRKQKSGTATGQSVGGAVRAKSGPQNEGNGNTVAAEKLETDVVPETPEGPAIRRSGRNKTANEEAPRGRTTRGGAAKRQQNAEVSSDSPAEDSSPDTVAGAEGVREEDAQVVSCRGDVKLTEKGETNTAQETESEGGDAASVGVVGKKKAMGKGKKGVKAKGKKRPESAKTNGSSGAETSMGKELPVEAGEEKLETSPAAHLGGLAEAQGVEVKGASPGGSAGPVESAAASSRLRLRASHGTSPPSAGPLRNSANNPDAQGPATDYESPVPETPNLRLTRSAVKPNSAAEAGLDSSAFGSPVWTGPESAVRKTRFGHVGSSECDPESRSKAPLFPESSPGTASRAPYEVAKVPPAGLTLSKNPEESHQAVQEQNETVNLSLLSPLQPLGRVTRSTSRAPESNAKKGSRSPPTTPAQVLGGETERSPASPANIKTPGAVSPAQERTAGFNSPLPEEKSPEVQAPARVSPTVEQVARVTRSASRVKSFPGDPITSGFESGSPSLGTSSAKRSRDEDNVSNQQTPTGQETRLGVNDAGEATPEALGVLTRSQGKVSKSHAGSRFADVSTAENASPDVSAGASNAGLTSSTVASGHKVKESVSPLTRSLNQQTPFASPVPSAASDKLPARKSTPVTRSASKKRLQENTQGASPIGRSVSSAVDLSTPEPSPTVDMDVCTTPLTAGPRRVLRPVTGKRNAAEKERNSAEDAERKCLEGGHVGVTSAEDTADVRGPLRRSPRLQGSGGSKSADERPPGEEMGTERASAGKSERSAKKMRLSGGFALTDFDGELIDLDNEDEDLVEPNFAVDSNGLRRSARKAASGRGESLEKSGKARLSFDVDVGDVASPGDVRKQSSEAEEKGSEDGGFRFSAYKSARKSARKGSAGRPSFVSASDEGSDKSAEAASAGTGEGSPGASDGGASAPGKTPAKRSNLMSGFASFLGFMPKKEPTGPPIPGNNKNTVKGSIKALEAAEAARREEAKKAEEREKRKAMQEKRREEKLKDLATGASQQPKAPTSKPADPLAEKRPTVLGAAAVTATITDQKLRRANEFRSRIEEEKARRLEEDQKKKNEERQKKDADAARKKRQREEDEKREREEKRRRYEDVAKTRREVYERQRAELEEKERKRKEKELEAERKQAADEEERKQKRKAKELEAERRRKDDDEKRAAKLREKEDDRKRQEGLFIRRKEDERSEKMQLRPGLKPSTPIKTFLAENATSARHSPLKGTDKIMPPPRTTPSRHAQVEIQNQYAAPSLSATPASRLLNAGYASSSLAAKPSGLQQPKPVANPPSNLRLTGWEDRTAKAKTAQPAAGSAAKTGASSLQGGAKALADRPKTPPPAENVESYEISPFKEESSDEDEEEDENESEAKKPIPAWARKENLAPALLQQMGVDPDDVFQNLSVKTCSLDQVFGTKGSKKKKDFGRRSSSGNWLEDRLTWKEELQYKKGMGYL